MSETKATTRAIIFEKTMRHPAEKVWRALTQADWLAKWLMPNDFVPRVGHRFTFATKPMGDWDGIVHCEVLACEPNRLLRYSWVGGAETNDKYGSRLNSVLTWTLTPVEGGTHVRMEHDGFGPGNVFAFNAMSQGWGQVLDKIERIVAEFDS